MKSKFLKKLGGENDDKEKMNYNDQHIAHKKLEESQNLKKNTNFKMTIEDILGCVTNSCGEEEHQIGN